MFLTCVYFVALVVGVIAIVVHGADFGCRLCISGGGDAHQCDKGGDGQFDTVRFHYHHFLLLSVITQHQRKLACLDC